MWLPQFVCPRCGDELDDGELDRRTCGRCARPLHAVLTESGDFLRRRGWPRSSPFARQYRLVRGREGYRVSSPDYYQRLPDVPADDPHAREWRAPEGKLQPSWSSVLLFGRASMRILDLGAGCGWMSHRLAALGHQLAAVDALDDAVDGLGASRHYHVGFVRVQADFDALPSRRSSSISSCSTARCTTRPTSRRPWLNARRMLAPCGALVVMDSPMFHTFGDLVPKPRGCWLLGPALLLVAGDLDRGSSGRLAWLRLHRAPARIRTVDIRRVTLSYNRASMWPGWRLCLDPCFPFEKTRLADSDAGTINQ